MFSGTQKRTPRTVFNLQALNWVHCEEETGAQAGISRHTYKLVILKFLKLLILHTKKKTCRSKKNHKIYYSFMHSNYSEIITIGSSLFTQVIITLLY